MERDPVVSRHFHFCNIIDPKDWSPFWNGHDILGHIARVSTAKMHLGCVRLRSLKRFTRTNKSTHDDGWQASIEDWGCLFFQCHQSMWLPFALSIFSLNGPVVVNVGHPGQFHPRFFFCRGCSKVGKPHSFEAAFNIFQHFPKGIAKAPTLRKQLLPKEHPWRSAANWLETTWPGNAPENHDFP